MISLLNLMARFVFVYRKIKNEAPNGSEKMMMRIVTRNQIDRSVIDVVDVVGRRLYCLCGGCTGV